MKTSYSLALGTEGTKNSWKVFSKNTDFVIPLKYDPRCLMVSLKRSIVYVRVYSGIPCVSFLNGGSIITIS